MSRVVLPTYELLLEKLAFTMFETEKLDLAIGLLKKPRRLAFMLLWPLTGSKYWVPFWPYQLALTMGFCTIPPLKFSDHVEKLERFVLRYSNLTLWLK